MNSRSLAVLLLLLAFLGVHATMTHQAPLVLDTALSSRLEAVLQAPRYASSRWGILVVDPDTGRTVYAHNADQLFAPASVTKVYSCAAALVALGADHRFETPVHRRGTLAGGRLEGDLILVARGDLTLGGRTARDGRMAFANDDHIYANPGKVATGLTDTDPLAGLDELARQVKASGVRQVTGDVLIDTRLFDPARGSGSGPDQVTPILVNDNLIDVVVRPGEVIGLPARYQARPQTALAQLDVQVETVGKGESPWITTERVGPQRWVVRGKIAIDSGPQVRTCVVDDPAVFARGLFIEALNRAGVLVAASPLQAAKGDLPDVATYPTLPRVAAFRSPPLSEALRVTLKVSHNLYASTLPMLLAVRAGKRSLEAGMAAQGRLLRDLGVDTSGISLESGAGGGDGDRVSPRSTVALLIEMRKRRDWAAFYDALPILGVDGTLHDVVAKDSPARGKVRGKTGTYTDSNLLQDRNHLRAKSLAGVLTTAEGKELVFTIFVNDVVLPPDVGASREGKVIGQLCEILHLHAR